MPPIYIALPDQMTSLGWMVFNRLQGRPTVTSLTHLQARTLAETLNMATGRLQRS